MVGPIPMWRPEFMAECGECGRTTFWHKANVAVAGSEQPAVRMGFKCGECGEFLEEVVDTRGKPHRRTGGAQ